MYEIQVILYWILGVTILNGGGHTVGWIVIGYGWFVFVVTIAYVIAKSKQLKDLFKN